jgi:hypothetical protein
MYEFFKYFLSSRAGEQGDSALRLMVPQAALIVDATTGDEECQDSRPGGDTWEGWNTTGGSSGPVKTPREVPSVSGVGLYGALSFNTVHNADNKLPKGNALLDISHS